MSDILSFYNRINGQACSCGKIHKTSLRKLVVGPGVIENLPEIVRDLGAEHPFLLADPNTWNAAGQKVNEVLADSGMRVSRYVFSQTKPEPDEHSVGSAVMHFDHQCDIVIGIGSGVINDIGKILSKTAGLPYIIVGTAPSMDGYNSATSSMALDGLKVSLPTRCPDVIIGDIDVLRQAPREMLISGLGDMLAKYVSICEWRIANLLVGDTYCENIASLVRRSLSECVNNAEGLMKREPEAVKAVFEGLVVCGAAMEFAGLSRPASGVEHYISHLWDMRGLAMGTPVSTHGIQCAIGTLTALKAYEILQTVVPDRDKAIGYVKTFDFDEWSAELRAFLGKGAETMIAAEAREQKYNVEKHTKRLKLIICYWGQLLNIMKEELPPVCAIEKLLKTIDCPSMPAEIGISNDLLPMTFKASKDIRDKYVLSRLLWDLGILDEVAGKLV